MPWRTMDVQQQRVEFVIAAKRGSQPFRALCEEFEISRPTGYLWLHRYEQRGVPGIAEGSRRPLVSPRRTAAELEERVIEVRQRYPDWGARKLREILAREGVALARNTIHRILLRHGLVKECDQHPPALQRFEREQPNQLWQMDFKGPRGWPQPVGPLSVLDDRSRYVLVLAANGSTEAQPVREQLEGAFQSCGVPEAMLMDHGTPWWSPKSPSGRTKLSLWLMRQGIRLCWSRIRHPQTQGKVERFHGSLQRTWRRRGAPQRSLQAWLDDYRWGAVFPSPTRIDPLPLTHNPRLAEPGPLDTDHVSITPAPQFYCRNSFPAANVEAQERTMPGTHPHPESTPAHTPQKTFPWRIIFRVIRWTTYISAAITIAMVLHKAPPPAVQTNPQAAARVEQKFEQVQQAVSAGQPAEMRMDQTELNSYLLSHLDIAANPDST